MNSTESAAWLRLTCTVTAATARVLLAQLGLPEQILAASYARIREVAGDKAANLLTSELTSEPSDEVRDRIAPALAWLERGEGFLVTLADADYPPQLLNTADPPVLLYARGNRALLRSTCVGIVGSRNPTPQGAANASAFAKSLAQAGLAVVSGMALGVDSAAHRGALEASATGSVAGGTIAVIGTGIDRIYPAANKDLARVIATHGLILSEYAFGTPPLKENFPRRNRIISGLSQGVLVVEAAVQSGSLITARLALEQGREVLAIPGSIHSPQARGCHALIKQGAKLVESAEDVLEELRFTPIKSPVLSVSHKDTAITNVADNETQNPVLAALGHDPCDLDSLSLRTGMSVATLNAKLLELELEGQVGRLPGGVFQRVGRA
jgi:DNA processing protein